MPRWIARDRSWKPLLRDVGYCGIQRPSYSSGVALNNARRIDSLRFRVHRRCGRDSLAAHFREADSVPG